MSTRNYPLKSRRNVRIPVSQCVMVTPLYIRCILQLNCITAESTHNHARLVSRNNFPNVRSKSVNSTSQIGIKVKKLSTQL